MNEELFRWSSSESAQRSMGLGPRSFGSSQVCVEGLGLDLDDSFNSLLGKDILQSWC